MVKCSNLRGPACPTKKVLELEYAGGVVHISSCFTGADLQRQAGEFGVLMGEKVAGFLEGEAVKIKSLCCPSCSRSCPPSLQAVCAVQGKLLAERQFGEGLN